MAFWTDNVETKRKYRFVLDITKEAGGEGLGFERWVVTKVTRPSFSVTDTAHSYLNHTFKFPGRVTWEDVSFSVVEPLSRDSTDRLMAMLYKAGYRVPSVDDSTTMAKNTSILATAKISAINAQGYAIDTWTLHNAWISQASLGDFDYSADDLMGIDITLKYDFATYAKQALHPEGNGPTDGHGLNNIGG